MYYDIKAGLNAQLSKERGRNDARAVEEVLDGLVPLLDLPLHHSSGFSHPELLIYTGLSSGFPEVATLGFVHIGKE